MSAFHFEWRTALFIGFILLISAASFIVPGFIPALADFAAVHPVLGAFAFIAAMFVETVVAPVVTLPTVPVVALVLGPLATAIYSIIGWTAGAVVAFLIARHVARPVLERYISLETIARYERHIPEDAKFWWVVLLRLVTPVDILSYAIGLVSKMPLGRYTAATAIGIAPFSFVYSYIGIAFVSQSFILFGALIVPLAIAVSAWYYIFYVRR